jgi:hypothetical protein
MTKRKCQGPCGLNRQEKFFVSERGRICITCQNKRRKKTSRKGHVKRTYNLSTEDHDRLLEHQGGVCAISGKKMPYNLAVDHDHKTGYVRGLLSKSMNKLLRDARDNPDILRAAADYLENPPAQALGIYARIEDND